MRPAPAPPGIPIAHLTRARGRVGKPCSRAPPPALGGRPCPPAWVLGPLAGGPGRGEVAGLPPWPRLAAPRPSPQRPAGGARCLAPGTAQVGARGRRWVCAFSSGRAGPQVSGRNAEAEGWGDSPPQAWAAWALHGA